MSDYPTNINQLRIVRIQKVRSESPRVNTIFFSDDLCVRAKAGQFVMVWIPGVDEIPLSLSSIGVDGLSSVTVAEVGEATKALNEKRAGDLIGIRGPFGNHFEIVGERALVIGGGIGMAPLMPLIENLIEERQERIIVILGAKTRKELIFLDQLEKLSSKVNLEIIAVTEDGSYGIRGIATEAAERVLSSEKFDMIYTCGPEKMIRNIYLLTKQYETPLQASLERIMRCAMGICGSCVIGKYRVCKDGPIFNFAQLKEVEVELGRFKRGFSGERIAV